jgi:hypothetical protein
MGYSINNVVVVVVVVVVVTFVNLSGSFLITFVSVDMVNL